MRSEIYDANVCLLILPYITEETNEALMYLMNMVGINDFLEKAESIFPYGKTSNFNYIGLCKSFHGNTKQILEFMKENPEKKAYTNVEHISTNVSFAFQTILDIFPNAYSLYLYKEPSVLSNIPINTYTQITKLVDHYANVPIFCFPNVTELHLYRNEVNLSLLNSHKFETLRIFGIIAIYGPPLQVKNLYICEVFDDTDFNDAVTPELLINCCAESSILYKEIKKCTNLQSLMVRNFINTSLDGEYIFKSFSNLRALSINVFNGLLIGDLNNLSNTLEYLSLDATKTQYFQLKTGKIWPKLHTLKLSNVHNLSIETFPELKVLKLIKSSFPVIDSPTKIHTLILRDDIIELESNRGIFPELEKLEIKANKLVRSFMLECVPSLKYLSIIELHCTKRGYKNFSKLTNLEELKVSNFTGYGLKYLKKLRALTLYNVRHFNYRNLAHVQLNHLNLNYDHGEDNPIPYSCIKYLKDITSLYQNFGYNKNSCENNNELISMLPNLREWYYYSVNIKIDVPVLPNILKLMAPNANLSIYKKMFPNASIEDNRISLLPASNQKINPDNYLDLEDYFK